MNKSLNWNLGRKYFNRKLENFYYSLPLNECKYIKERLEKSMLDISLNNVSKVANSESIDSSDLSILYLEEISMIRSVIAMREHKRIEDIRERYKKKLKRKFI